MEVAQAAMVEEAEAAVVEAAKESVDSVGRGRSCGRCCYDICAFFINGYYLSPFIFAVNYFQWYSGFFRFFPERTKFHPVFFRNEQSFLRFLSEMSEVLFGFLRFSPVFSGFLPLPSRIFSRK